MTKDCNLQLADKERADNFLYVGDTATVPKLKFAKCQKTNDNFEDKYDHNPDKFEFEIIPQKPFEIRL